MSLEFSEYSVGQETQWGNGVAAVPQDTEVLIFHRVCGHPSSRTAAQGQAL